jgi:hypothetical protein
MVADADLQAELVVMFEQFFRPEGSGMAAGKN